MRRPDLWALGSDPVFSARSYRDRHSRSKKYRPRACPCHPVRCARRYLTPTPPQTAVKDGKPIARSDRGCQRSKPDLADHPQTNRKGSPTYSAWPSPLRCANCGHVPPKPQLQTEWGHFKVDTFAGKRAFEVKTTVAARRGKTKHNM